MLQRVKCAGFSLALLCLVAVNLSQAKTDIDKLLDSAWNGTVMQTATLDYFSRYEFLARSAAS